MKLIQIAMLSLLTSCSGMDSFFNNAEEVLTDGVVQVQVDKEAFLNDDVDVHVAVDIINKDQPAPAPVTK